MQKRYQSTGEESKACQESVFRPSINLNLATGALQVGSLPYDLWRNMKAINQTRKEKEAVPKWKDDSLLEREGRMAFVGATRNIIL